MIRGWAWRAEDRGGPYGAKLSEVQVPAGTLYRSSVLKRMVPGLPAFSKNWISQPADASRKELQSVKACVA